MRALAARRRFEATRSVFILGILTVVSPCAGADSHVPEKVLARAQALDRIVQERLELVRLNLESGTLNRERAAEELERLDANLAALGDAVRGLPPDERERLEAKLHALSLQLENLRLASRGDPPILPRPREARALRVDRGPDGAAQNDACAQALIVELGETYEGDSSTATNDGQASCGASLLSPDVWFRYVPATAGQVAVDTLGSSYDTVLSVHSACPGTVANELECNDDIQGLQSGVSLAVVAGYQYLIRLAGMNGVVGLYRLSVDIPGIVSGAVVRADDGEPMRGYVDVWTVTGSSYGFEYTDSGSYEVDWLPSGTYFLSTRGLGPYGTGILDELWDDIPCPFGAPSGCNPTAGDPVAVTAGGQHPGVDFVLDVRGGISGTVTDAATGEPLMNAEVEVWDAEGSWALGDDTGADGSYLVHLPQPGTHFVTVEGNTFDAVLYDGIPCPGGPPSGCDPLTGTPVEVVLNTVAGGVDFAVHTRGRIEGTVRDEVGSPFPYATVALYEADGDLLASRYTGSQGTYAFVGLSDGAYFLTAGQLEYATFLYDSIPCPPGCDVTSGTPIAVTGGGTVANVDFTLVPLGSLAGTIVESPGGAGVAGVPVKVCDASRAVVATTSSASDGSYVAQRLWDGAHFVIAGGAAHLAELYDDHPCDQGCDPLTGTPVPVALTQQTPGVDFALVPKGSISGQVLDQVTGQAVNLQVLLFNQVGTSAGSTHSGSGGYRFTGLSDGPYFVATRRIPSGSEYLEELYDDLPCWGGPPSGCTPTSGTAVMAMAGTPTTGIDLRLERRGEIRGTVADVGGGSAGGGQVRVLDADGDTAGYDYWSQSDPTFSVDDLVPGSYHVVADSSTSHRDEVWRDRPCDGEYPEHCSHVGGTLVEVAAGGVASGIDFTLDRLGEVRGAVLDSTSGEPLSNTYVRVFEGGEPAGEISASSTGQWAWTGAWPGVFTAATDYSRVHLDQLYDGIPCPGGPGVGCDPTSGTSIPVGFNSLVSGVDFHLPRAGGIAGRVVDELGGEPISGLPVAAWDSGRRVVSQDSTDSTGAYELQGLATGDYFVATNSASWVGVLDELYDDIPCLDGPPDGCDPVKGTPVPVVQGATTRFVDFVLRPWGGEGITGRVTDQTLGGPLGGVVVDLWDGSGQWRAAVSTGPNGIYVVELPPGTYRVSTDNALGYLNEVFDDVACPGGSAYSGACDPLIGDPVEVSTGMNTQVDFALEALFLFLDGFEGGTTSAWSLTVP